MSEDFQCDPTASIVVSAGHWTNDAARTGCTVFVFDRPAPAAVDIRGGAPGTRETDLLGSAALVQRVDALVFSGGSAFGLAVADGVMAELDLDGRGFSMSARHVPIVPAAILYDLGVGLPIWPDADSGRAAYAARGPLHSVEEGRVGCGAGATTGKLDRDRRAQRGGFGLVTRPLPDAGSITIAVVVNSIGTVVHAESGSPVFGLDEMADDADDVIPTRDLPDRSSSTLAAAFVDSPVDRRSLERVAVAVHDGMARAVRPCHTIFDGDVVFAVGLRDGVPSPTEILRMSMVAERATEEAIVRAVTVGL